MNLTVKDYTYLIDKLNKRVYTFKQYNTTHSTYTKEFKILGYEIELDITDLRPLNIPLKEPIEIKVTIRYNRRILYHLISIRVCFEKISIYYIEQYARKLNKVINNDN